MFFEKCRNLVELKHEFKRLVMRYHPDRPNGDEETMKAVNAEYDKAFEQLKRYPSEADEAPRAHATAEVAEDFRNILDVLVRLKGIEIELCGSWLWISGDTFAVKDELKAAGCRWQRKKAKWYWHPPEAHVGYGKKPASMSWIRNKYGSQLIRGEEREREALTA
ncbi:MAG: hypothetical protein IJH04_02330 [Eggerthellaceae bacterium]|nr:hypothetical protein [Eggerthellaceae bacterium]